MNQFFEFENIAPGISELSHDEIAAMQKFTLLWTLFEAQALDNQASASKIITKVKNIKEEIIRSSWFNVQLEYFIDRYTDEGTVNDKFNHLNLRKGDKPDLVHSVLCRECDDPFDQLIVCLIIIYRLRNNLFHGLKWSYGLKDQLKNFTHATILLRNYLEIVRYN